MAEPLTGPPIQNAIAEAPSGLTPRVWARWFLALREQAMLGGGTEGPPGPQGEPGPPGPAGPQGEPGPSYTDEQAQDAVGTILTEGPTVEWIYDDALPGILAQVKTQRSILYDANGLMLNGDVLTPGATQLYGTNGAGTKGWYAQPATFTLGPTLTTIEALTGTANTMLYFTGTDVAALSALSAYARTLLDDADAATMRGTLLLGTASTQAYTEGTFMATATGFSGTAPSGTAHYRILGKVGVVFLPNFIGTSNATTFTVTGLPAALTPVDLTRQWAPVQDNGVYGHGVVTVFGTGLTVTRDVASSPWTATGAKALFGHTLTYVLA